MNEEDLKKIEGLCEAIYRSHDSKVRSLAEQKLSIFSDIKSFPQLQEIFAKSRNPFALFFAASQLRKLFTENWTVFSMKQKADLRNYMLNYIGQHGHKLPHSVLNSIMCLLSRVTKLGWLEEQSNRDLPEQIKKYFVQANNPNLVIIGLQLLRQMIMDMNVVTKKTVLTQHRKVAVSFRDVALRGIFESALFTLKEALRAFPNINTKICAESLELALSCLRFDFVGIFPEDASDDAITIQVPSSWRPLFEESNTVTLMWQLYETLPQANRAKILEILVGLASVRRSLFTGDDERKAYLEYFMKGILKLLENPKSLADEQCYHQLCRLLARIKSNFQLRELVAAQDYPKFIEAVANFTVKSFQNLTTSSYCVYYLLNLWSRLVASKPYLSDEKASLLDNYAPTIFKEYITSRLRIGRAVFQDDCPIDDPLEETDRLEEQLEALPTLAHMDYEAMCPTFITLFDPLFSGYRDALSSRNYKKIPEFESQLTWLCYMYGAVVSKRVGSNNTDQMELLDGDMGGRIIRLTALVNQRIQSDSSAVDSETLQRLEIATLYFMKCFKKIYLSDTYTSYTKIYTRLKELLDLPDQLSVLNVFINKIANNLKIWAKCEKIVRETMDLFSDIALGYSSAKLIIKLDTIKYIINNHSVQQFPFLAEECNMKNRTTFHCVLCKLLFTQDYTDEHFSQFMSSTTNICTKLEQINNAEQFRHMDVKTALMGVFRDLRGICEACQSKRTFTLFFDWVYPARIPLLLKAAQVWYDKPEVMTPLLKFLAEFVLNRTQRISFDPNSANGILLFREVAKIIVAYGTRLQNTEIGKDPYKTRYKGVSICLTILGRAMSGGYCCFGVFSLYNDRTLVEVLSVVLKLAIDIPLKDIMAYPKLRKSYFDLMEILFTQHTETVLQFSTPVFLKLVASLEEGIKSEDLSLSSQACSALDHVCTFYYTKIKKNDSNAQLLTKHLQQAPNLFPRILAQLFNMILFEECGNQWSVSRTMLSLIVINPKFYEELKKQIASQLPGVERQAKMMDAFKKLMEGVEMNVDTKTKDKFTGNLIMFKQEVKGFL